MSAVAQHFILYRHTTAPLMLLASCSADKPAKEKNLLVHQQQQQEPVKDAKERKCIVYMCVLEMGCFSGRFSTYIEKEGMSVNNPFDGHSFKWVFSCQSHTWRLYDGT